MLGQLRQLLQGALAFFQVQVNRKAEERRRLIRLRCAYQVQCVVEQQQFEAQILDMGLNGMRLLSDRKLKPGSNIFVYHPSQQQKVENEYVLCLVRWARRRRDREDFEAGLQYADTPGNMRRSWVKFLLKELGFDERAIYTRRKLIRASAALAALVVSEDGRQLEGTVINLGAGGALFETEAPLAAGSRVRLRIGPLDHLKLIWLTAVIIHHQPAEDRGGAIHMSLRFEDLKASQVAYLGQYVLWLLKSAES